MAGDRDPAAKGMSAYDRYQELAGHPERMPGRGGASTLASRSVRPHRIPRVSEDAHGSSDEPGTKIATLASVVSGYRKGALAFVGGDQNVRLPSMRRPRGWPQPTATLRPTFPTAVNTTNSFLGKLEEAVGMQGLQSPTGVTPSTALPKP